MMIYSPKVLRNLAMHCFFSRGNSGKSEIAQVFKGKEGSLSAVGCSYTVLARQELTYSILLSMSINNSSSLDTSTEFKPGNGARLDTPFLFS